ncbi:MAG TPA: reactive intermediate/imine deaminase [Gammaproteobacteria bacterium]|jgi:reactive intermediate/imine deaminase|nr:MAG: reactive intermediate/imine deaminase [Candidatus Thioglobus sp. MED-G23]RPG01880.1 MAG: RidA family protein [Proteobacteria bacterium TMED51]HAO43558.1 reactive intermediate/imine deaminase [Afipia sp.]HAU41379.1 reactive intermediate/imine deaminase [Gammaproteobacteria bacterium]HBP85569.1 reactive intermediate/imine deaminase [Gammaproteobacteria bacterium]|tara:strand:+ start:1247 stop:1636 length:390 start_codon:yes stop_codon:yes gene_type:complete
MTAHQPIHSNEAPNAIGPYSQAVRVGDTVYLSGQIPLDPQTMELVEGDIGARARRVFDNLAAVMQEANGSLSDIVKLTIYLVDLEQFGQVNEVMAEYFDAPFPSRATVAVAALPKGAPIEVEAVAHLAG